MSRSDRSWKLEISRCKFENRKSKIENRKWGSFFLSFSIFYFLFSHLFCSPALGSPLIIEKGTIKCDTVWEKEVIVAGDAEIDRGATLTVMPGTVVKFVKIDPDGPLNLYDTKPNNFPGAELIIRGTLIAQGTKKSMIVFTSAEESPRPADWGAINFLDSRDNILEYCEVAYGYDGIHGHGAQINLVNCYLHDNGVGIGYKNVEEFKTRCMVTIIYNRIIGNGGGILCGKDTRSIITHNQVSNNKFFGVFGKKAFCHVRYNSITHNGKGVILYGMKGFRLSQNNVSHNDEYNMSLLEGQTWDVDARHNWWGTSDEKKIKELIWDRDEDESLGKIDFSDFAVAPIEGTEVSW